MKKVIYIALVTVGFLAVSCSKENIKPCAQNSGDAPVWRSSSTGTTDGGSTGGGSITDPNNDPDESSRKKN